MALAVAGPVPSDENHDVKKRSPDDLYYFVPHRNQGFRGSMWGRARTRGGLSVRRPLTRGYFLEVDDDLYDDRRKRHLQPSDSAATRQKRAADFDDDDFGIVYYRRPLTSVRTYTVPRTSVVSSPAVIPVSRYFYDDDDFDRRKKRSADFDDDDFHYVFHTAATPYSLSFRQPVISQARTRTVAYTPTIHYVDFDDKK